MIRKKLKKIAVSPGYKCNFKCAHCCNLSGVSGLEDLLRSAPSVSRPLAEVSLFLNNAPVAQGAGRIFDFCQPDNLTSKEILTISRAIRNYGVGLVQFTGGETTFYLKEINQILEKSGDLSGCRIAITTNGHFAKTIPSALKVLSSVCKLDIVQLSYDKFHKKFLPFSNVKNIKDACVLLKKRLTINLSIQSPTDLLLINDLNGIGIKDVQIQKVLPVGAAKLNRVAFPVQAFDKKVLSKKCPGINAIVYLCGRGFSHCCVTLALSGKYSGIYRPTVGSLLKSKAYRLMADNTFGQIMKKLDIPTAELKPEHSSECILCEYIFGKRPEHIS